MPPQPAHAKSRPQQSSRAVPFLTLTSLLALTASAHAGNLITDPGFEAAGGGNVYYAGQTIDNNSWTVGQGNVYIDTMDPYVYDGNNSLNLTYFNPFTVDSITQSVATTPGQKYLLTFWADSDSPNTFSVTENSIAVTGAPLSIADNGFPNSSNIGDFTEYSGVFVANSATTLLDFASVASPAFGSGDGDVVIDDVNLVPTPEPQSIALILTGAVALALVVGKDRLRAAATS